MNFYLFSLHLHCLDRIEKSFHNFRSLEIAFKKATKDATEKMTKTGGWSGVPESTQNVIAFSDAFAHVIDSEPQSNYMGKVSTIYPKSLTFIERHK